MKFSTEMLIPTNKMLDGDVLSPNQIYQGDVLSLNRGRHKIQQVGAGGERESISGVIFPNDKTKRQILRACYKAIREAGKIIWRGGGVFTISGHLRGGK